MVWVDCIEEQFKDVNRHSRKDLSLRKQSKCTVDISLNRCLWVGEAA